MKARFHIFSYLRRQDSGTALVEFAILLPMLLLLFAVTIEGGRMFWAYQNVAAGVRDATRYVARAAPISLCETGDDIALILVGLAEDIVRNSLDGTSPFPTSITVVSVTASHTCIPGIFRVSPAPVVQITAVLEITFPFASVFNFAGQSLGTITTSIFDQSRIYGT